jgi:hypothetical protein
MGRTVHFLRKAARSGQRSGELGSPGKIFKAALKDPGYFDSTALNLL